MNIDPEEAQRFSERLAELCDRLLSARRFSPNSHLQGEMRVRVKGRLFALRLEPIEEPAKPPAG